MPALTVLMPVYNAEKFLAEAIDSILQQTFADFEFIIIDDGSEDSTAAIVASYSDTRIRFVQNERNLGISATLNKGIILAAAPLIARMDADDISCPERLQKQFEYMQANPDCAMVSSLVKVITEDGQLVRVDQFRSEFFYYNLTFICWIYHPTVMYRKAAVEEAGMYAVPYAEDFELFWQLSRRHKIYNLPEIMLHYRVSSKSLHQVLKKKEYEQAQHEQLLRNFRYYAGKNFTLPTSHIECLQHNFEPILAEASRSSVLQCLKSLDAITEGILYKENTNRNIEAIKKAAFYKRNYILTNVMKHLTKPQKAMLLISDRNLNYLSRLLKNRVRIKFKNVFSF
ncbi:glycosyltransferase [Pontibacter qinzhouensis]|uniref:Glycosyltransferase n=1 Tax=Pontibacter qinzhouensis TaxID=2603253 RepID=A0A5C8IR15_9BACT|nr:glycosyltransferase [Pontibacter qinzhouensis]TXK23335.1 glycosyltransferase [Pontibacter qinzhouensis]